MKKDLTDKMMPLNHIMAFLLETFL